MTARIVLRRRLCCAAAAALLTAGCGSSAHHSTSPSTPQASTPGASNPAASASSTTGARASAAAGGSRAGASAKGRGASAPAGAANAHSPGATSPAPVRRFIYLANQVCRDAGGGAPVRPVPTAAARLRDYARVALPPAQSINLSLRRLSTQTGHTAAVSQLLLDYQKLLSLYRQATFGNPRAVSASSIAAAQKKTTTAARALHLPLCAPVPFSRS